MAVSHLAGFSFIVLGLVVLAFWLACASTGRHWTSGTPPGVPPFQNNGRLGQHNWWPCQAIRLLFRLAPSASDGADCQDRIHASYRITKFTLDSGREPKYDAIMAEIRE